DRQDIDVRGVLRAQVGIVGRAEGDTLGVRRPGKTSDREVFPTRQVLWFRHLVRRITARRNQPQARHRIVTVDDFELAVFLLAVFSGLRVRLGGGEGQA